MTDSKFHFCTEPKTLGALAELISAELHDNNDEAFIVSDVAPLDTATSTDISFIDNAKYKQAFQDTKAGACIVHPKMVELAPNNVKLIISKNPYKAYALIAQNFYPVTQPPAEISSFAHIDNTAKIGKGCIIEAGAIISAGVELGEGVWIGANTIIERNVVIGTKTRVGSNATISHAIIGEGTRIYPGVRIGQDGFGFAIDPAGHVKVPQLGRVIIGDNVEIGANTCIDRGAGPDTIIGDGAWLDNLVQIAHNVKIGRGCVIVSQTGIAGSSELEDFVVCGGQVGIAGHVKIGQGSQLGAQSGVISDLPAGSKVLGSPCVPIKDRLRQLATLKKLTNRK